FYIVIDLDQPASERRQSDVETGKSGTSEVETLISREEQEESPSGSQRSKVETQRTGGKLRKWCFSFCLSCLSSLVWFVLFVSDGRYVACITTTLNGEYADSSHQSPWEWCDKNRTLTADQSRVQFAFYASKMTGFIFLSILSAAVLLYKCCCACCKECRNEQDDEFTHARRSQLKIN
ncbi:hypothetical protein MHYP_G00219000, partial [Metynnis hypsauchen]